MAGLITTRIDDPYYDMFAVSKLLTSIKKQKNCWLWKGKISDKGYGIISYKSKNRRAHRVSYVLIGKKSLTPGLELHHKCRNRNCINPDHLEELTRKEHACKDGYGFGKFNAQKKVCIRGHPFAGDNLYITSKGYRQCQTCMKIHMANFYTKKKLKSQTMKDFKELFELGNISTI